MQKTTVIALTLTFTLFGALAMSQSTSARRSERNEKQEAAQALRDAEVLNSTIMGHLLRIN